MIPNLSLRHLTPGLLVVAACAGGGPESAAPPELAYVLPPYPDTRWTRADTARLEVDAGGRTAEISLGSRAEMEVAFAEPGAPGGGDGFVPSLAPEEASDDRVRVEARYLSLEGFLDDPFAGDARIDPGQVAGGFGFTLSPRGRVRVTTLPVVSTEAAAILRPHVTAATFLPTLPARAYEPGLTWTDTVDVRSHARAGVLVSRSVLTFTARGDTTFSGRRVLRVTMEGTEDRTVWTGPGRAGGGEATQSLSGTSTGYFLWDPALRLPTVWVHRSELQGALEVEGVGFPYSVRARAVSRSYLTQAVERR